MFIVIDFRFAFAQLFVFTGVQELQEWGQQPEYTSLCSVVVAMVMFELLNF